MRRNAACGGGAVLLLLAGFGGMGCSGPVLREQQHQVVPDVCRVVAVVPFQPSSRFPGSPEAGAPSGHEAAALVGRFVSEALEAQGVEVVPPSDVRLAFEARGWIAGRGLPEAAADLAAGEFGASSVLLGNVYRFRERRGGAQGAMGPASVAFELALHTAPAGVRVWTARFDETQQAVTENLFRAREYPGRGTRWLTAAELARWGAEHVAHALRELP